MRNYFTIYWVQGDVFLDDGMGGEVFEQTIYGAGATAAQCNQQIDAYFASTAPKRIARTDLGQSYFLANRLLMIAILNFSGINAQVVSAFTFSTLKSIRELTVGGDQSPRESQYGYKSEGGGGSSVKSAAGKGGTLKISLLSYLLLLLQTWQGVVTGKGGKLVPGTGGVPQRWIEWLTLLISHYGRYTPTQIYGFLARVDFTAATFKV